VSCNIATSYTTYDYHCRPLSDAAATSSVVGIPSSPTSVIVTIRRKHRSGHRSPRCQLWLFVVTDAMLALLITADMQDNGTSHWLMEYSAN